MRWMSRPARSPGAIHSAVQSAVESHGSSAAPSATASARDEEHAAESPTTDAITTALIADHRDAVEATDDAISPPVPERVIGDDSAVSVVEALQPLLVPLAV